MPPDFFRYGKRDELGDAVVRKAEIGILMMLWTMPCLVQAQTTVFDAEALCVDQQGEGAPLLLIGGLGNRMAVWDDLVLLLGPHFRLIRFDPAGIGCSEGQAAAGTVDEMARHVAALLTRLNIKRCHVAGISLGGFVAQSLALQFPERVDKLVLIGTSMGGKQHVVPDAEVMQFFATSSSLPRAQAVEQGFGLALRPDFATSRPQRHAALVARESAYTPPAPVIQKHAMAGFFFDYAALVEKISAPTLVLHGGLDRVVPPANGKNLGAAIAGAQTRILPKAGHLCIIDSADEVAAAMKAFLAATPTH